MMSEPADIALFSEQQLRAAAQLLGTDELGEVRKALYDVLEEYSPYSKANKRKLKAYTDVLRRVETANRSVGYPLDLYVPIIPYQIVQEHLAKCQRMLAEWPKQRAPKRNIDRRRSAAREALRLLAHYGHRTTTTRRGKWCRLAAILYGDPNADLFHQCCEIARQNQTR